jgi:hypothetical protein
MHPPVEDAEHLLQVLSDTRSPAALQLLGYASAAQRAAGVSRLVLHALVRFLRAPIRGKRHSRSRSRLVDLGEMGRDQELHHALHLCSGRREFTGMELKRPLVNFEGGGLHVRRAASARNGGGGSNGTTLPCRIPFSS